MSSIQGSPSQSFVRFNDQDGNFLVGLGKDGSLQLSNGSVFISKITLTPDQITNLAETPVAVVPAPGPNKILQPISVTGVYNFGTTPYNPNSTASLSLYLGPVGNENSVNNGDVGAIIAFDATTAFCGFALCLSLLGFDTDQIANQPLWLVNTGNDYSDGDGTMTYYITYNVVNL